MDALESPRQRRNRAKPASQRERGRPPIVIGSEPVILNAKVSPEMKDSFRMMADIRCVNTSVLLRYVISAYLEDICCCEAIDKFITNSK